MNFSDEVEINELEAASIVLASQNDPALLGRSLLECAIIRLHQHRKYVLNIVRILGDLSTDEEREGTRAWELAQQLLQDVVFASKNSQRIIPRCMAAMKDVRGWIQKLNDKITAAAVLSGGQGSQASEELETIEFSRVSLIQQHELMGLVVSRAVETQGQEEDFKALLAELKAADKYDSLLGEWPSAPLAPSSWLLSRAALLMSNSASDPAPGKLHIQVWISRSKSWSCAGTEASLIDLSPRTGTMGPALRAGCVPCLVAC